MWKDRDGREWHTTITVNTVRRVRELTDVLLTDAADNDLIERLYGDVLLLCDVLYAVCKPEAEQRGIDADTFGELLANETIDQATESFMGDLIAFFPSGRRQRAERILTAAKGVETERVKLVEEKMTSERLDQVIKQAAEKAGREMDRRLAEHGDFSGRSPALSESTPDH